MGDGGDGDGPVAALLKWCASSRCRWSVIGRPLMSGALELSPLFTLSHARTEEEDDEQYELR